MGDINIDCLEKKQDYAQMHDILRSSNMYRLDLPAIRITPTSHTSIDCVCCNNGDPDTVNIKVINTAIPDHMGQLCTIHWTTKPALTTTKERRNFNNPDFDDFVLGVMNATFSSAVEDDEQQDIILHNLSESETDPEVESEASTSNKSTRNLSWTEVSNSDPGPSHTIPIYSVNHEPNLPISFDSDSKPIEYFDLFFNDEIIDYIVYETNLYANKKISTNVSSNSRLKRWNDISC
ncbi:hypothetical protein J6590_078396 [Homalodisca vitripennis]|nr:hypothetical protein J6590_078396 [Homalodisca vitripennis]